MRGIRPGVQSITATANLVGCGVGLGEMGPRKLLLVLLEILLPKIAPIVFHA